MRKVIICLISLVSAGLITAGFMPVTSNVSAEETTGVKWYSIEEAQALSDKNPRKIFLDINTSWCGWCKVMDKNTFMDPTIAKYMNANYYCVKFDAETHDTVTYNGQKFWNRGAAGQRSVHDFAATVLRGKMSYPSYAFISKDRLKLTILQGYYPPDKFEPYLHYYANDKELTMTWEEFLKTFKSELPPAKSATPPQAPTSH
ncbi:MAG TPA: DUF255 domain-containing protein [Bacteroidia bacterium]|nr:DUF255 domain-containing protein [Bacteroidia bacterium]